uniref:Uncharacterized protein n=1 Tax=Rhizophora mucronata TaxID=61149 RepID=A0A2P2IY32_RHIMU
MHHTLKNRERNCTLLPAAFYITSNGP